MPESHGRAKAARKKQVRDQADVAERRRVKAAAAVPRTDSNRWVVPAFITTGLLGVLWLITYYIAGHKVPFMATLGNWNVLIGIVLFMTSFVLASFWK